MNATYLIINKLRQHNSISTYVNLNFGFLQSSCVKNTDDNIVHK